MVKALQLTTFPMQAGLIPSSTAASQLDITAMMNLMITMMIMVMMMKMMTKAMAGVV